MIRLNLRGIPLLVSLKINQFEYPLFLKQKIIIVQYLQSCNTFSSFVPEQVPIKHFIGSVTWLALTPYPERGEASQFRKDNILFFVRMAKTVIIFLFALLLFFFVFNEARKAVLFFSYLSFAPNCAPLLDLYLLDLSIRRKKTIMSCIENWFYVCITHPFSTSKLWLLFL